MNIRRVTLAVSIGIGATSVLILLSSLGGHRPTVNAGSPRSAALAMDTDSVRGSVDDTPIHYVATTGTDSGDCGTPGGACQTIQYAVDQAGEGDEVRVAAGRYSGVSARSRNDVTSTGLVTQVVYISKTVTVRGGYTTLGWTASIPVSYPTILDAQRQGRVLYITGDVSPTIEGLHITGGDADELAGDSESGDYGGGAYIFSAAAIFTGNWVFSNTADYGGGLALWASGARLTANIVMSNSAVLSNVLGGGGGLYLNQSPAALSGNYVSSNTTNGSGGGLHLTRSDARLVDNRVISNTARFSGGGLYSNEGDVTLSTNVFSRNEAEVGGGLYLWDSDGALNANIVLSNTADSGGGVFLWGGAMTLTNSVIADNRAQVAGSGLHLTASAYRLLHTTVANNGGGDESGVTINGDAGLGYASVLLTNTILANQGLGVNVREGNTATLESTLWHGNTAQWRGVVHQSHDYEGDPAFVDPVNGDYHIGSSSAAIDRGVNTGVTTDIDGETRPGGVSFDIGADEFFASLQSEFIYLPFVAKCWPPIPTVPVLNPIDNADRDGFYVVTWQSSDRADGYILEEAASASFSDARVVYEGTNLSWSVPQPGKAPGTYLYRVRAENTWGECAWSNVQVAAVGLPGELVVNGGFETGPPAPPWVQSSNAGEMIDPLAARSGNWGVYMGGAVNAIDLICQEVVIPTSAPSPQLSYWRLIRTTETSSTAYDEMRCVIWDQSGGVLGFCGKFSNASQSHNWIRQTYDMSAFRGRTVDVGFKAFNDSIHYTQFFIDDVSLMVSETAADAAPEMESPQAGGRWDMLILPENIPFPPPRRQGREDSWH